MNSDIEKWIPRITTLFVIVVASLSLFIFLQSPLNVNSDIAYFVDGGIRILDGQRPYVDFFNVNLITIQYLYVIPVILSNLTGVPAVTVWIILCWLQMIGSMYLSFHLAKAIFTDARYHLYLIAPMAIAIVSWSALFTVDFGQREQLFALYAIPWLFMRYGTWTGALKNSLYQFVFGFVFAIIATIKPYFALGIIILELYWGIRFLSFRKLLSPAIYGIITATIAYLIYFLLNPDVFTGMLDIVRLSLDGYANYKDSPLSKFLVLSFQIPMLVASITLLVSMIRKVALYQFIGGVAVFIVAGALIVTLQTGVNLYYYFVMQVGAIFCIGFIIVIQEEKTDGGNLLSTLFLISLGLFVMMNTVFYWKDLARINLKTPKDIQNVVLANTDTDDNVLFLSAKLGHIMPWLRIIDRNQASSYMTAWVPVFALDIPIDESKHLQQFRDITRDDIDSHPTIIIIDTDSIEDYGILSFLEESKLDELIYTHYRLIRVFENYEVYKYDG